MGQRAYLTPQFFTLLGRHLGDAVVLMLALHDGTPVAGALNLGGRGCALRPQLGLHRRVPPSLHFELCYYRAIEFAIAHGLARVESRRAGRAQDPARLPAFTDLFGALDRQSRAAPGGVGFPRSGTPRPDRGDGGAERLFPVPSGVEGAVRNKKRGRLARPLLINAPSGPDRNANGRADRDPNAGRGNCGNRRGAPSNAGRTHT